MKIIMLRGLPASGKSTWAKQYVDEHPGTVRLNKDDMREMFHNGKWSKSNEKFILELRDWLVTNAILSGTDIIVDDTNLHPKHEHALREIVRLWDENVLTPGVKEKVEFEVKDFYCPPTIAEERDALRPKGVGQKVIRQMWRDFICKSRPKVDASLPTAILCDLDGTIAHGTGRNMYDYSQVHKDMVDPIVRHLVHNYHDMGYKIIFLSGRKDDSRQMTAEWLEKNVMTDYENLFMRKADDNRPDWVVKREIYEAEIKDKYNVLLCIDDRQQVCDLWREEGLKVLQVEDGTY